MGVGTEIVAMAVFSKEVKCCLISRIKKSGFQESRRTGCELGRRSQLRHTHLRRQRLAILAFCLKLAKNLVSFLLIDLT